VLGYSKRTHYIYPSCKGSSRNVTMLARQDGSQAADRAGKLVADEDAGRASAGLLVATACAATSSPPATWVASSRMLRGLAGDSWQNPSYRDRYRDRTPSDECLKGEGIAMTTLIHGAQARTNSNRRKPLNSKLGLAIASARLGEQQSELLQEQTEALRQQTQALQQQQRAAEEAARSQQRDAAAREAATEASDVAIAKERERLAEAGRLQRQWVRDHETASARSCRAAA